MVTPVVLVTGCSKGGIGFSMSAEFAAKGCRVYAGVRRLAAAQELEPLGVILLELDVIDERSREAAVARVLKEEGRLDILVNNAGIVGIAAPLPEAPLDSIQLVYETNVFAPIALTQLVVPHMIRQKSGLVINISSASAYMTAPYGAAYASSKAAITSATNALRLELKPHGIHVMHVPLGCVKTLITSKTEASIKLWKEDSLFASKKSVVQGGSRLIHHSGITPEQFATTLVSAALRRSPPGCLWAGGVYWIAWIAMVNTLMPVWLSDWCTGLLMNLVTKLRLSPTPELPRE